MEKQGSPFLCPLPKGTAIPEGHGDDHGPQPQRHNAAMGVAGTPPKGSAYTGSGEGKAGSREASSVPLSRHSESLGRAGPPPNGQQPHEERQGPLLHPPYTSSDPRGAPRPPSPQPKKGETLREEHGFPPQKDNGPTGGNGDPICTPPPKRTTSSEGHRGPPPQNNRDPPEKSRAPLPKGNGHTQGSGTPSAPP